ncbi:MAG: RHS repeat-associated core domain-containing protein [Spirochaetaceae bacterium]|jgi:RHS repeat-associated protein|nr:RHS repeat-associated core domain-containing protein [Spirochaetaceae bacterium]
MTILKIRGEKVIFRLIVWGSHKVGTLYANGEPVYLEKDIMGSARGISNDYGLLEDRYEYDAFGKPYKGDLNSGMNLGYTGKPYDTATGLYNYGYRDYKPEVARFTTVDPIRDGVNWFAYVNNDPVNWVDLWGLLTFQIGISATGGAGTGATIEKGIIVAWDPAHPLSIEIGSYTTTGVGAQHYGAGGSVSLNITTSTNSKADDMKGSSVVSGGSLTVASIGVLDIALGTEMVISLEGKNPGTTASIGLSAGSKFEAHTLYTYTDTAVETRKGK